METILERVDAVTKIGQDRISSGGVQPPPVSVKIELTARCSLRCKFCALRTRTGQAGKDMDIEVFKKITEDMRVSGVQEIGLFYLGESFMAPRLLVEACRWVKDGLEFPWVFLTSNAVAADPDRVMDLMEAGLDSLKWSVNCHSVETYESICGGTVAQWNRALQNIREAIEIRNTGHFGTILSASSILFDDEYKARMKPFLVENVLPFVDKHYWLPMYSMSMYRDRILKDTGFVASFGNMGRIDEKTGLPNRNPLPCWAAFTEGHVRVDGGLSACCFGADNRFDMGHLDGKNFMQEWNSERFQKLREAQLMTTHWGEKALENTPCRVCVAWGE